MEQMQLSYKLTNRAMTLIPKKYFKINNGLWKNYYLWVYTIKDIRRGLGIKTFTYAKKNNIRLFSTPFDVTAVDFLEKLNCPFYKVSSFEMNDLELIKNKRENQL